ncbi:MAG: shikimate dehydrogenase [Thiomonas sp. 13-66-29]|nr:MAG: shikimate dehydrogenase [Thiomonas sp. 15-66-11]OZB65848.1 MAG: shikimate dehydrogenase [Thiomonas sp. 13-66-29]
MSPGPDMSTDLYAVLGNPVEHSKSPRIHALFAAQCEQRLRYEKRLIARDGFSRGLHAFRAEGGKGCNVTVPFKFEAAAAAQRLSPRAALAGAANTLGWDDAGVLWADNTDGIGLVRDLARILGRPAPRLLAGFHVLLLGAGGAASGVLGALIEARPAGLDIWNRSADRARDLAARHAEFAARHGVALRAVAEPEAGYRLLINATASSLDGMALSLPNATLHPGVLAYDLMYAARATPFMAQARAAGAAAEDGLGMLVEQAAESFALWRGMRPDTAPVLAAMQTELRGPRD